MEIKTNNRKQWLFIIMCVGFLLNSSKPLDYHQAGNSAYTILFIIIIVKFEKITGFFYKIFENLLNCSRIVIQLEHSYELQITSNLPIIRNACSWNKWIMPEPKLFSLGQFRFNQGNASYLGNFAVNFSAIFIVDICNYASDCCSNFLDGANMSAQCWTWLGSGGCAWFSLWEWEQTWRYI